MRWSIFRRWAIVSILIAMAGQDVRGASLLPTQAVCQCGGGMGSVSAGAGWRYGAGRRWETEMIVGIVPRHDSSSTKAVVALKENFVPWSIKCNTCLTFEPLTASVYFTTILSRKFWLVHPDRYPAGYYPLPTKVRSNLCLGQRLTWHVPYGKSKVESLSAFYEIGTCDLYAYSAAGNGVIKPRHWLQLCLGIRINFRK